MSSRESLRKLTRACISSPISEDVEDLVMEVVDSAILEGSFDLTSWSGSEYSESPLLNLSSLAELEDVALVPGGRESSPAPVEIPIFSALAIKGIIVLGPGVSDSPCEEEVAVGAEESIQNY